MNKFYVTQRYGDCGTNLMFHNKNGAGYGTNIDNLEEFSLEQAQFELNHDIKDGVLPLLVEEVQRVSIISVDMQGINAKDITLLDVGDFVIQVPGFNGNDIYLHPSPLMTDLKKTNHLNHAIGYSSLADAARQSNIINNSTIWPYKYLLRRARRTIQRENINVRKMITGAGIKYKKPRAARPTTGKTRLNCQDCGRIVWDYNPHEPVYCDLNGCGE